MSISESDRKSVRSNAKGSPTKGSPIKKSGTITSNTVTAAPSNRELRQSMMSGGPSNSFVGQNRPSTTSFGGGSGGAKASIVRASMNLKMNEGVEQG